MKSTGPFTPFRNRGFSVYWLVGLFSNVGWMIQMVGASWLMVSLDGTPDKVALVQTAVALPMMLFSLPAGAMADAFGRRTTVIFSQTILLFSSIILAFLAFQGLLVPWTLLMFTFLIGMGKALGHPGWQTMVAEIVEREQVPAAISLNSIGINLARTTGPAVGGVIVATVGAFASFVVNALVNLGVIVVAWRWKRQAKDAPLPPERVTSAMMAGLRYVALSPNLLKLISRSFVFNFAGSSVMALLPLIARDIVGGGPEVYGFQFGSFGVGGLFGAIVADRLRRSMGLEAMARTGFLAFGFSVIWIAFSRTLALSVLGMALAGLSWLLIVATFNTVVQLSSPRWVLGRCQALFLTASFSGVALGGIVWGQFADRFGTTDALLISAGTLAVGAAIGVVSRIKDFDTSRPLIDASWQAPDLALVILPKSGPIISTIEYRIREVDVPRFRQLMQERRRRRMRDGARSWSLSRDLMDKEIWLERYKTPTWIETQRHHSRRTVAGAELSEKIRNIHQGEPPRVRYEIVRPTSASASDDLGLP